MVISSGMVRYVRYAGEGKTLEDEDSFWNPLNAISFVDRRLFADTLALRKGFSTLATRQ